MAQSYSIKTYFNTLFTDFIALIYPEVCVSCGDVLLRSEHIICLKCLLELPKTYYEDITPNPVEKLYWGKILVEQAAAGYFFHKKSHFQQIIHSFKYRGDERAARFMGENLGDLLLNSKRFKNLDVIIPIPLHPDKLKKRGYNQAERIAEGISYKLGIPVDTTSIIRVLANETQTKKSLFDRWTNVESIFKVAEHDLLEGKHVLLVDDVITSGSTIEACACQILEISSTKVSIATLAIAAG